MLISSVLLITLESGVTSNSYDYNAIYGKDFNVSSWQLAVPFPCGMLVITNEYLLSNAINLRINMTHM